jgi:sugar lactone lactonase YvrE
VEELIRSQMHDALDIEAPPPHLRANVMGSLPVGRQARRPASAPLQLTGRWAAGVVATVLAIATIVGLLYSRGLIGPVPVRPQPAPPAALISPEGVLIGADGSVYLSDLLGDRVFKVRKDGRVVVVAGGGVEGDGPATKAWLDHPVGLTFDRAGNLYIADATGGSIRIVDPGGVISTLTTRDGSGASVRFLGYFPMGIAFDSLGVLWVSQLNGTIQSIDPNGNRSILDTSSLPPPTWVPGYIAFDPAGNLYISDRARSVAYDPIFEDPGGGCRIVRVSSDKKLSVIAGTGVCGYSGDGGLAVSAQLNDPSGIAFDSAGNLYFSDSNNHRIRRIDRNGIITTVAGTGIGGYSGDGGPATQAQLEYPFGIGITPAGLLYFADATCSCWNPVAPGHLRALNLSNDVVTTVMSGQTPIQASG